MKHKNILWGRIMLACLASLFVMACQKVDIDDIEGAVLGDGDVVLQFNVTHQGLPSFNSDIITRAEEGPKVCTKLSLAVYKNDKKISQLNQTSEDEHFGTMKVRLPRGTYQVLLIAHNGQKPPTMTKVEKVTFNGKVTDTYYYYGDISVENDSVCDVALKHAVAMFRLKVRDEIPGVVARMRFYYTGGSSTFDAVEGVGCVASRQTEFREVSEAMHGKGHVFEVYTFPRGEESFLQMKATAYDGEENVIQERIFSKVKVRRNYISQYAGGFFSEEGEGLDFSIDLVCPEEWGLDRFSF